MLSPHLLDSLKFDDMASSIGQALPAHIRQRIGHGQPHDVEESGDDEDWKRVARAWEYGRSSNAEGS